MKRALLIVIPYVLFLFIILPLSATTPSAAAETRSVHAQDEPYFAACAREGLNESECAGRLIWFKATAGNDRFHTYVFQQRVGVLIDWYRVLRSDQRGDRFRAWGIINDPACCTPGTPDCPAKSVDETYGMDWCPGDEELLGYVGRTGYRDPACDFRDAPLKEGDEHGPADQRQSACDLKFGTSTGALGIRKFPNPRFDKTAWQRLNRSLASWAGYNRPVAAAGAGEAARSHLQDGAIEPPFLIGTACGSCHIAFDPLNPPADPANPKWENIKGLVGNQYTRISEIMVSGMPSNTLEWQMFAHARPGASDTSAIPTDQINNPGTINALINIAKRPTFAGEQVMKWRKAASCAGSSDEALCWCEPGHDGKCWKKSLEQDTAHHILKGGEDSIGALEAIQRVYFNIGSCSEQCWMNHLSDLRQLDPQQRGFGQMPFNIGQCRRDCPNFRAIEDRLPNILDFFMSAEAHTTDLRVARENQRRTTMPEARYSEQDLVADLEREFGENAVARGREIFANTCARCHSSQPEAAAGQFASLDFHRIDPGNGLREDWLGNDRNISASEVGTYRCRALHSNHMSGHIWQEYGSETLRAQPPDANVREPGDGGRGHYRNISLLNLWAHAPFLHNNALGPELCGKPRHTGNDFYAMRPRYVDGSSRKLLPPDQQPACFEYDPSIEGRYRLYKLSMHELLNPAQRAPKVTLLNEDITLRIGPRLWDGTAKEKLLGFQLTIPSEIDGRGVTAGTLGNFQHKQFIVDLVRAKTGAQELEASLIQRFGEDTGGKVLGDLKAIADELIGQPNALVEALKARPYLIKQVYSSCTAEIENEGHRFGEDLSEADKKALIAFLATL